MQMCFLLSFAFNWRIDEMWKFSCLDEAKQQITRDLQMLHNTQQLK
jgi:hypothetical protein